MRLDVELVARVTEGDVVYGVAGIALAEYLDSYCMICLSKSLCRREGE